MKKTVLTFGLISGLICSVLMVITVPFGERIGFDRAEFVGYTIIVLSFLLVFFGIRSYRDNVAGGAITFGKAFTVGILITLITCVFYVVTWLIVYYNFMPNFIDEYGKYMVQKARVSGARPEKIQAQIAEIEKYKSMYANPFINAAMTFMEPFPIGLLMTLLSAIILRKKKPVESPATA